jgi:hypothetical protein
MKTNQEPIDLSKIPIYARIKSDITIPQHVKDQLAQSPNASPTNSIVICKLSDTLYTARWILQPVSFELDVQWDTTNQEGGAA